MAGPALTVVSANAGLIAANPSTFFASALPPTMYQFVPHTTIPSMQARLAGVAARGYSAIQVPPLHPVSTTAFASESGAVKLGSAYAPKDIGVLSPYMYAGVSADDYLAGNYAGRNPQEGWIAFRRFVGKAKAEGLAVVVDLVLGHTARDADVIAAHVKRFGESFYKKNGNGEIVTSGAIMEGDIWDIWWDIAPIDHNGPARARIMEHMQGVVNRFIASGVAVFRVDAAPRIPGDFLMELIRGAKEFASAHGYEEPVFYAEALSTELGQDVDLIRAGFNAVTNGIRWWDYLNSWFLERYEAVRLAGGGSVGFVDTHDTDRFAATFLGHQQRLTRFAMTAFMTDSMIILEGTKYLVEGKPNVFLGTVRDTVNGGTPDASDRPAKLDDFMRMVIGVKNAYPVLRSHAYTQLIWDGSPIRVFERKTDTEVVQIALNVTSDQRGTYRPPTEFARGFAFGTNMWSDTNVWYGVPDLSVPEHLRFPIDKFDISPGGMAVFHRRVDPSKERLRIPGLN